MYHSCTSIGRVKYNHFLKLQYKVHLSLFLVNSDKHYSVFPFEVSPSDPWLDLRNGVSPSVLCVMDLSTKVKPETPFIFTTLSHFFPCLIACSILSISDFSYSLVSSRNLRRILKDMEKGFLRHEIMLTCVEFALPRRSFIIPIRSISRYRENTFRCRPE